ncbi:PepSY domain-containing protein [Lysobacter sp. SG-8]|uniref:PepSY domain-containing protein n=1 Tax=Marilutibacter penaei TaxID=2759900 RepID=A0A7W3YE84_9GAMM|nr:PepSY domain-containing protein [Lysobacter penaei]MBB1087872.1 PepSY domain-containing protein [Lysobacter penaei]
MTRFPVAPPAPRIVALSLLVASLAMVGGAAAQGASDGREQPPRDPRPSALGQARPSTADPRAQGHSHLRGADRRALSEAVRRVERRTGGQVLSAERIPYDGRNVNRIKVVDARGRVRVYMDDPNSSRPLRSQPVPQRDRRTQDDDD